MKIVILTGAGISAESGLGTFRDEDGLWTQYDLNDVATPEGFARNPHWFMNSTMPAAPIASRPAQMQRMMRWRDCSKVHTRSL